MKKALIKVGVECFFSGPTGEREKPGSIDQRCLAKRSFCVGK